MTSGEVDVSLAEQTAAHGRTCLGRDPLGHLNAGKEGFWRSWFAFPAVVALRLGQPIFVRLLELDERFLQTLQQHSVKVRTTLFYGSWTWTTSIIQPNRPLSLPYDAKISKIMINLILLPRDNLLHVVMPIMLRTCVGVLTFSPTKPYRSQTRPH